MARLPCHIGKRPRMAFVKAKFDGALYSAAGVSGMGVVIKDSEGNSVAGLAKCIPRISTPDVIEFYAAKAAMKLLLELELHDVILEGHSQKVVQVIQTRESV